MAKAIKFNLKLDGNPVRDINGLQENFCINDILDAYENGLLQKWLKVRGYNEHLQKVEELDKGKSIIAQIIKIFGIEQDDDKIKIAIYSLEFEEKRKREAEELKRNNYDIEAVINSYHMGYENVIGNILEQRENMSFLKSASKELSDKYHRIFMLDYKNLYETLKEKSQLMVYAILMNESPVSGRCPLESYKDRGSIRSCLMEDESIRQDLIKHFTLDSDYSIKKFFGENFKDIRDAEDETTKEIKTEIIKERIGFCEFKASTDGYWKDLETEDTKVMVLSIPQGTYISTPENKTIEYDSNKTNGGFLILEGLLYKSNNNNKSIAYMKV